MPGKLLVVDDAAIIRAMISDTASAAGWTVVAEAKNGQEAIDAYGATHPDAVTLDMVMPEFDGLHAVRGIRALDQEARIVVVSAVDQKETLKAAFKLGAADFLIKPFDRQVLVETLEKALAGAARSLPAPRTPAGAAINPAGAAINPAGAAKSPAGAAKDE